MGDVGATRADNPFLSRKKKMIRKKKAEPTTKPPANRKRAARRDYGEATVEGCASVCESFCLSVYM